MEIVLLAKPEVPDDIRGQKVDTVVELEEWLDQQLDLCTMPDLLYVGHEIDDLLQPRPAVEALERMFDYGVFPRLVGVIPENPVSEELLALMGYIMTTERLWLYLDDVRCPRSNW